MQRREWPDCTSDLEKGLAKISSRLRTRDVLRAVGVAAPCAGIGAILLRLTGANAIASVALAILVVCVAATLWLRHVRAGWTDRVSARTLEATRPESRNVVITAEELLRYPRRATQAIRQRVVFEAAEIVAGVSPRDVVSLRRPFWLGTLGVVVAAVIVAAVPSGVLRLTNRTIPPIEQSARGAGAIAVTATIVAPAYTHEPPKTITNPDRIDALQGSLLTVSVRGGGPWRVRFGTGVLAAQASSAETRIELQLSQSGYLAIEPTDAAAAGMRRLLPVAVVPDRAPTIRIEKPGKDLLLPHASQNVELSGAAADDFGLQSLEFRYTKVSGSGEQFDFKEGTLPLSISRESGRDWRARAVLALNAVGLAPGDSLIYRLVGRDERPGDAGLATSDTYFIEIAGPGQVALAGFELPPDRERYALSQQMIVLKLVRLRAKEKSLDRATLEEEVGNIAAEQRAVRANFVFLMGGEVEDEEAEAEHSHEIQEGRLENTARREIMDAIQHMGRVEIALAAVDTGGALPPARAAVEALQRAFGRNRYILRTLPTRSRVDPSRRLTGDISSASNWRREISPQPADAASEAARALLGRLLELSPSLVAGAVPAATITGLAEDALSIDAAADDWQQVSRALLQLRDSSTGDQRSAALNQAVGRVSTIVARSSLSTRPADGDRRLRSAWAEERGR